jgi:hypothetical protein
MASRLTTVDNPYDPFTQYDEWYVWDTSHGYHTNSYLARITFSSKELSDPDQALIIEKAIDEIVTDNINGMYRKVTRDDIE